MNIWDSIFKLTDTIEEQQQNVFAELASIKDTNEQPLNHVDNIPNYYESINSIRARLTVGIGLCKSLQSFDTSLVLIPMSYLSGLKNPLNSIAEDLNKITGAFSNLEANGGIASINTSNLDAISVNQSFTFNFGTHLQDIDTQLDHALDCFYKINVLCQRPDYSKLDTLTEQFSKIFDDIATQKNVISELAKESKILKKQINDIVDKATSDLNKGQSIHTHLEELKTNSDLKIQEISTLKASATEKLPYIEDLYSKSVTLKKEIDNYQPQFELFQTQLDSKIQLYNSGDEKLNILLKSLRE